MPTKKKGEPTDYMVFSAKEQDWCLERAFQTAAQACTVASECLAKGMPAGDVVIARECKVTIKETVTLDDGGE